MNEMHAGVITTTETCSVHIHWHDRVTIVRLVEKTKHTEGITGTGKAEFLIYGTAGTICFLHMAQTAPKGLAQPQVWHA